MQSLVRTGIRQGHQLFKSSAQSQRNYIVVFPGGKKRMTFVEECIHKAVIVTGILATPVWVLFNIKNYRRMRKEREQ